MGMTFLQPWAWLLAIAVAVPIALHLLVRDRSRRMAFPTVRFLDATRLSSVTRRALQDWPLLLLRIVTILAAVAALAGPVFVTPERRAEWTARIARAVVLEDRAAAPDDELRSARPGAIFARDRTRDAVADAVRWLTEQHGSTREIVVLSAFRRGAVDEADFVNVPADVGIRLVRTADAPVTRVREISRLQLRDDGVVRVLERVTLEPEATEAREVELTPVERVPIVVTARPDQRAEADAALRAVLRRGVRLPPAGLLQPVEVPWTGDVESLAAAIDRRVSAPLDAWEPEMMSDTELARLARPPAHNGDARPDDHGDRRAMWALVLVLLAVETWFRRGPA